MLAMVLLALLPTLSTFPATWSDGRSHGFVVAAYAVWLAWKRRVGLHPSAAWRVPGLLAVSLFGLVWLLSIVVGIRLLHQAAAVLILLAWASTGFGPVAFARYWPVAAVFSLALPFWEVLLGVLQSMTVMVNHGLILVTGIPATLDGTRIHFTFGTIEVAQSCAGLAYFMSALTIGVVYAHQFLSLSRARIAAVMLAVVLALVSNWIRVFGLVVIGYRSQMQSPLMTEHAFYGWVIFAVVISLFFLLTGHIERWERRSLQPPDSVQIPAASVNPAPACSESEEALPLLRRSLLLGTAAALVGPLVFLVGNNKVPSNGLPATISGIAPPRTWQLHPLTTSGDSINGPWLPSMTGEKHRAAYGVFESDSTRTRSAEIVRFGYEGNGQGHELIGGANAIAPGDHLLDERVVGPLDERLRTVRQAVVRTRTGQRLVWYWYRVAGVETTSPARAKLLEVAAFFGRTSPSELVAVSAPCGKVDCQTASMVLHQLVTGRPLPQSRLPGAQ
jgi:exosortase